MSETEEGLSQKEVSKDPCGVILGYWDHEKTPELIQDLEQSVNLVEKKCKKLLEELMQYKKYLEKSKDLDFHLTVIKMKNKKSKSHFSSGSDPDIAFRKNLINFQKIQQTFEEKFQEKLFNINRKLTETALKIGLKNNIILLPRNDYLKTLQSQTENEQNTCYDLLEKFAELNLFRNKTKSDSLIIKHNRKVDFSKITKNELKLYQKLSRLRMKRRKKNKKLKGRKVIFFKERNKRSFVKKKTLKCRQDLVINKMEWKNLKSSEKNIKNRKKGTEIFQRGRDCFSPNPSSTVHSQNKLNESEIKKTSKSWGENICKNVYKSGDEVKGHEHPVEGKSTLGAAIRKAVPFTTCTSTSRSYNIGLNIQQLLSLSKHKKIDVRTPVSEKMPEITKAQDPKTIGFKQKSPDMEKSFRKARSKYTGSSTRDFLEYHKSTMNQYTNGQNSVIQSESKTAYAMGLKIMVSDCQRTDIFQMRKNNTRFENASGDGTCNERCAKLNLKWSKVYNSFLSIYRKYSSMKKKISYNGLALTDEELKSLENEIDYSIEKYKDFLQFYSKFLHLNHRLKSLKIACETEMFEPVTSFFSYCHEKLFQYKPTYSMAMRKAFREVQALQDKIKLFSD